MSIPSHQNPDTHDNSGEVIIGREVETAATRRAAQRPEPYLRGPIPARLIGAVLDLPGRPLHVFLAIWHRCTVSLNRPWVTIPASLMAEYRFDRKVKARALAELERAGLIAVKRAPGRAAQVSLLAARKVATSTTLQ